MQEKYQDLYQAYRDKTSKLSILEGDNDQLKTENGKLRDEVDRLRNKNEELNSTLLAKNMELEDAYRKLQSEMRGGGGGRNRGSDAAIDKLEDGLREAITSNFQILRESALSELKRFVN
jgi:predicted nuclease with TOPRIM domain